MSTTQRIDGLTRLLGYGCLLLALTGVAAIILAGGSTGIAVGIPFVLLAAGVLAMLPAARDNSLIWLVTGAWTGFLGVISLFSVGIIFLIATFFLLAAFVRANW